MNKVSRYGNVTVVGHPTASIGMGEHVRSVWRSLSEVGIHANVVDIYGPQGTPDETYKSLTASALVEDLGNDTNIFCINGDEIEQALGHLRHRNPFSNGSRNIIYPAWELERYPDEWAKELNRFDEVWAQSKFTQSSIQRAVTKPVVHVSESCEVRKVGLHSRRDFGIPESSYAFLFSFDFLSYVERKNPFAVIEAFQRLTERRPYDDVVLVLKTNNSTKRPKMKEKLDAAAKVLGSRLVVIDKTLPELSVKGLVWLCDCFVSLHRSEGYGRGLSEAMALAKPVIATAYSGNMDYCSDDTSFLVPYELIPVRSGEYPHWEDQRWADPDVEFATETMIKIIDDPELGRKIGKQAQRNLSLNFGYLPTGLRYLDALMTPRS